MILRIIIVIIPLFMLWVAIDFAELQFKELKGSHNYNLIVTAYGIKKGERRLKGLLLIIGMFTPMSLYYVIRKRVFKK